MEPSTMESSNQVDGAVVIENHKTYYYDLVVFEKVRFLISKNGFLLENPKFFDQFDLPKRSPEQEEGVDSIMLKDTTSETFHGLLLAMYPFPRSAWSYEEWPGALDLATKWDLSKIRAGAILAISGVHKNGAKLMVEIILLGRKYNVAQWLEEGYIGILKQADLKDQR
ncbi:hypothetical protein CPB83DRAFT_587956 [Crepidotus variabilis]|uniref:BTB domain-containing protein n=1 Tax=Crepidotus variabilis TaxID=179855 RepID=A0A9P6EPJ4_9AGAR|nr:hypothetical protein CPB83DRAFT_587956 [Crepidotus variabilis]